MKAIVYAKYGTSDRITYTDIEQPKLTADNVLVQVHAVSLNKMDEHILNGKPFPLRFFIGFWKPKYHVLGSDFSGVIVKVGTNVTDFKVGDEVFGQLAMQENGSLAEYAVISPRQLTHKPATVSHRKAATLPVAGLTALQALRETNVTSDTNLLIYGASGGVGTFMIQIAKALGANVTAVCSTRNIEVAKKSNADVVIDYKKELWDKNHIQYDVIIGVNGYNSTKRYRDALTQDGVCMVLGGNISEIIKTNIVQLLTPKKGRTFLGQLTKINRDDLDALAKLIEKNDIQPYIDREYPIKKAKEAFVHFMSGKTVGKTIVLIRK